MTSDTTYGIREHDKGKAFTFAAHVPWYPHSFYTTIFGEHQAQIVFGSAPVEIRDVEFPTIVNSTCARLFMIWVRNLDVQFDVTFLRHPIEYCGGLCLA